MELWSTGAAMIYTLFLFYCLSTVSGFEMKTIYCTISDSCDCDFKPNIQIPKGLGLGFFTCDSSTFHRTNNTGLPNYQPDISVDLYARLSVSCGCDVTTHGGLEWDLYKNLYGQHLAQDIVSESVASFLKKESPDRPLVLSFHGGSGTGKSMVSTMLGRHLYGTAMGSPYIHQYVPTLHFPIADRVKRYRSNLKSWVQGNLTACARSIFIFDEMEKMPPGVIDVLEPFLGPSHVVFQTNYRKAIYIFISTAGQEVINRVALESRQAGREREEIQAEELEEAIADAVYSNKNSGFYQSKIISEKLIAHYVPFLPLRRRHVERCAQRELCQRGECQRRDVAAAVGGAVTYTPQDGQHFSSTGCKLVPAKVNLFL